MAKSGVNMNENNKSAYHVLFCTAFAILAFLAIASVCLHDTSGTGSSSGPGGQIARVEENQQRAIDGIERAGSENRNAAAAVDRASDAIAQSEKRTAEITAGLDELRAGIEKCQNLAKRNAELIADLEKSTSNRKPAAQEDGK